MTEQPDSARNLFPDLVASVVVAGISLTGPENAFLASAQAPIFMHMARRSAEELAPRIRTMRAGRALAEACKAGDLSSHELEERVSSSTVNVDLTDAALLGAATARYDARIVALGRALAAGLLSEDEATVDLAQLVIAAVSDLDASHVRLLDLACEEDYFSSSFAAVVAKRAPTLSPHFGVLMATLTRHHLIETQIETLYDRTSAKRAEFGGGVSFAPERMTTESRTTVTQFGRLVRTRLYEAGSESLHQ